MYQERLERVCDYIQQNLDEELDLDRLSQIAALSKFHFQRMFSACIGVSPTKYIRMARLKRASFQLVFKPESKIIDIAFHAGFESPGAFTRAFKRDIGQTPSDFQQQPDWESWHQKFKFSASRNLHSAEVRVVNFEETKIAYIEHWGSVDRILETAAKFIQWRKEMKLSPVSNSLTFGIPYSDPKITEPEEFRFDICGSIIVDIPENEYGIKNGYIPPGRCAVVRHYGSHDDIDYTITELYEEWLPKQQDELRDYPPFFHYLNFAQDVDECDLMTDIYLPLK